MTADSITPVIVEENPGNLTPESLRQYPGFDLLDNAQAGLLISDLAVFSRIIYQILAPSMNLKQ